MSKLNELVNNVYVLNLDRRADRMVKLIPEMDKYGITFERFSAVDGSLLSDTDKVNKFEVACSLSHLNIIQDAKNRNFETICVFEDDVQLNVRFNDRLEPAFKSLPEYWELFYLGANNIVAPTQLTDSLYRVHKSLTTHAYILHKRAFDVMLSFLDKHKNSNPADNIFTMVQTRGNSYIIQPNIAYQKQGFSDIRQGFRNYDGVLKK